MPWSRLADAQHDLLQQRAEVLAVFVIHLIDMSYVGYHLPVLLDMGQQARAPDLAAAILQRCSEHVSCCSYTAVMAKP